MCRHKTAIIAALVGLLWPLPARAEPPPAAPVLAQVVRSGYVKFGITSGRISISGRRVGNVSTTSTSGGRKEKLSIRSSAGQPSISYERADSSEQLSIDVTSDGRISIRRTGKEDATIIPVEFSQTPNEPISLVLDSDDRKRVYRAADLWQLLIAQREECRKHLIPILGLLRPDWNLAEAVEATETALLRRAAAGELPDHRQWAGLVQQLGDERFSRREVADRRLREAGQAVVSYLRNLDFSRLDAEQQFRVQRIIKGLSRQTVDDTPEVVARRLVADQTVWLALLSRPEESTRRLAARQLSAILSRPIPFDPAADPAVRERQIEQLRAQMANETPRASD